MIWKRVAEVYTRVGPEIWSAVRTAVRGNPFVGDTFAAALEAWLLDQGDAVDTREPLYVLELGAGTGMFSHPFVAAIARRRANGTFAHPRVVLVLCDQSEMRFDAWAEANVLAKHRQSGELVEAGAAHYGVLAGYARDFAEASVLIPVAAIRVAEALLALSGGRLLLLALDKGITGRPRT